MTTSFDRPAGLTDESEVTLRPLPRSGQRNRVLGGLLLVAVSGALVAWLFVTASDRTPVLVVARDVPVGARITAADLITAQVGADSSVRTVPETRKTQMVGLFAAVDLRAGTLLTPSELTDAQSPQPGQMLVPVAQKASQLPALSPGDQVTVVPTPGSGGQDNSSSGNGAAGPLTHPVPAVVDQVTDPDAEGTVRVQLLVSSDAGSLILQQASTGRWALAVTARRG